MRRSLCYFLALALLLEVAAASATAQEVRVCRRHHAWGQCSPGAWKLVRVVTDSLNDQGEVTGHCVTETKTTLAEIDDEGVTLEVRTIVEVAGKRFESEAQVIKQGFHGDLAAPDVKVKDLGAGTVTIEERQVPCRIEQTELTTGTSRTVTKIYYSDTFAPYVLKRESVTTDLQGKTTLGETTVEVVAVNMPCEVLSDVKCAAQVKTLHKHANGTISTLAFVSSEVPGGVISHQSKETDKNGHVVRSSMLKLISYSFEPESERIGLFGRKRPSRFRKTPPHFVPPMPQD